MAPDPLAPFSAAELTQLSSLVRTLYGKDHVLFFKALQLQEPTRKELVKWYASKSEDARPPRLGWALYDVRAPSVDKSRVLHETVFNLDTGKVIRNDPQPAHHHTHFTYEEISEWLETVRNSAEMKAALAELDLPEGYMLEMDPFSFGADEVGPKSRRCWFMSYIRTPSNNHPDSMHYCFPLPLVPYLEIDSGNVVVELAPTGGDDDAFGTDYGTLKNLRHMRPNEYHPELLPADAFRQDLNPYQVVQPEGPSFKVDDNVVTWQKWSFRVGFNWREGPVLHNVRYDGRLLFHRVSISEMTVPYADPRPPYHRKQAFDLGDAGAGLTANSLKLGCDCLGNISYFSFLLSNAQGEPQLAENVVCLHEQDDGILSKHTNWRTGNPFVQRDRRLVLQTILTVGNYEYIFAFQFDLAANLRLETRATGVLSVQPIEEGKSNKFGTIVNPGVWAPHHQHLFSLRIEPAIDGYGGNTVLYEDSVTLPPSETNPYGNGYTIEKTVFRKSGFVDLEPRSNRTIKVINPNHINAITKGPVGYKIHSPPSTLLLAHPSSITSKRADFAQHHVWVTKANDNELFSGGVYTNQSWGETEAVRHWADRKDDVENADPVVWITWGLTHNVRIEDWPIMPAEISMIELKPVGFFEKSPAWDVPYSSQAKNKSTLVKELVPAIEQPVAKGMGWAPAVPSKSSSSSCCNGSSKVAATVAV